MTMPHLENCPPVEPKRVRRRGVMYGLPDTGGSSHQVQAIETFSDDPACWDALIAASQAAVDMWDGPLYKLQMKPVIDRLRNALKPRSEK